MEKPPARLKRKALYLRKIKRATHLLFYKRHRKPGVKGWELRRNLGSDYPKVIRLLDSYLEKLDLQVKTVFEGEKPAGKPTLAQLDKARFYVTLRGTITPKQTKLCVTPDTYILLENGCSIKIGQLERSWNRHEILTCDWNNDQKLFATPLSRYIRFNPNCMDTYKIQTKETHRIIRATADHPFYTNRGLIEAKKLRKRDKVVVFPIGVISYQHAEDNHVLNQKDIKAAAPLRVNIRRVFEKLRTKNLLPLKMSDERLLIIARVLGHLLGDGGLYWCRSRGCDHYHMLFTGEKVDLEKIKKDMSILGFNTSKIMTYSSRSLIRTKYKDWIVKGKTNSVHCPSVIPWVLFKALGAPIGDKATSRFRLPRWLLKAPIQVQREFLAAFFGSELLKPTPRYRKDVRQPVFSIYKAENLLQSGLTLVEDLKRILKAFGVKVHRVQVKEGVIRKSGLKTKRINVLLSSGIDNLLNLYGKIGFRYSEKKENLARYVYEYLTIKKIFIKERSRILKKVKALKKKGFTYSDIVLRVRSDFVKPHDIWNWIHRETKTCNIKTPMSCPAYKEWLKEATLGLKNGLVWETVESVKQVKAEDVCDVTTASSSHNFIANGFLISNCGWRIDDIAGLAMAISYIISKKGKAPREEVEELLRDKLPGWRVDINLDRYIRAGYLAEDKNSQLYLDWRTRAEVNEKALVDLLLGVESGKPA